MVIYGWNGFVQGPALLLVDLALNTNFFPHYRRVTEALLIWSHPGDDYLTSLMFSIHLSVSSPTDQGKQPDFLDKRHM